MKKGVKWVCLSIVCSVLLFCVLTALVSRFCREIYVEEYVSEESCYRIESVRMGGFPGADSMNSVISSMEEAFKRQMSEHRMVIAEAMHGKLTIIPMRWDRSIVSLKGEWHEISGNETVHHVVPMTFDARTGKELLLGDLFAGEKSMVALQTKLEETCGIIREKGYLIADEPNLEEIPFYLTADSVVLYIPRGLCTPTYLGETYISVPYDLLSDLKRKYK